MDEPDFATAPEFVRAGFDRVMAGIDCSSGLKVDFYDAWLPAHRSGSPREERNAVFIHFGFYGWRWPALDAAAALFEGGNWPLAWDRMIDRPYRWDDIHPGMKMGLLVQSLGHAAYTARDLANLIEPTTAEVYRIGLSPDPMNCPVEAQFRAIYGPAIAAGDYSALPPFFPGSRSALRAVSRRRGEPRDP